MTITQTTIKETLTGALIGGTMGFGGGFLCIPNPETLSTRIEAGLEVALLSTPTLATVAGVYGLGANIANRWLPNSFAGTVCQNAAGIIAVGVFTQGLSSISSSVSAETYHTHKTPPNTKARRIALRLKDYSFRDGVFTGTFYAVARAGVLLSGALVNKMRS